MNALKSMLIREPTCVYLVPYLVLVHYNIMYHNKMFSNSVTACYTTKFDVTPK